jgi:hypothetical protein
MGATFTIIELSCTHWHGRRGQNWRACCAPSAGANLSGFLLSTGAWQPARVLESPPQKELHLSVNAAQVVRGPPPERVQDLWVQTQEKCLPLAHV